LDILAMLTGNKLNHYYFRIASNKIYEQMRWWDFTLNLK